MYVCLCKGVTDSQIRTAVIGGADSMRAIRQKLGVMTECGKCACDTHAIIQSTAASTKAGRAPLWSVA